MFLGKKTPTVSSAMYADDKKAFFRSLHYEYIALKTDFKNVFAELQVNYLPTKQENGCFLPTKAPVPSTMCGLILQTENNTLSEKLAI